MKSARLAVLGIAIVAGAAAVYLVGRQEPTVVMAPPSQPAPQPDTVDILVARNDINVGKALTAQDLLWQAWPTTAAIAQYIRRTERPAAANELAGAIARTAFAVGEPIREEKLLKGSGFLAAMLPRDKRAISIEITPETGVGGFILPNDRVDLLLTRAQKTTSGVELYTSETFLTDIRVLAIDQTVEEKNGQRVIAGRIATLEVTPRQAESVAVARRFGSISLILRSLASQDNGSDRGQENNLVQSGPINIVRFGNSSVTFK